jgi:hypothetical protein
MPSPRSLSPRSVVTVPGTAGIAALAALSFTLPARAADPQPAAAALRPDVAAPRRPAIAAPWLYGDDASAPDPLDAVAVSRFTFTNAGSGAIRPFAASIGRPGALVEAGGVVGLTRKLSLEIMGINDPLAAAGAAASGMIAGLRFTPLGARDARLAISGGVMREIGGAGGVWARVSVARELGRLRVAAMVHGEHIFAPQRDALDVMVTAGASYRLVGPLRAGVEYVAQDVEETFADDGAEAGMRHFVGPTIGVELADKRFTLTGGPALGLSRGSPTSIARVALAYSF